jgi:hypothetical protein
MTAGAPDSCADAAPTPDPPAACGAVGASRLPRIAAGRRRGSPCRWGPRGSRGCRGHLDRRPPTSIRSTSRSDHESAGCGGRSKDSCRAPNPPQRRSRTARGEHRRPDGSMRDTWRADPADGPSSRVYPATGDFVPLVTAYGCTCRPEGHQGIRAGQGQFWLLDAEGVGFEPTSEVTPRSGFQDFDQTRAVRPSSAGQRPITAEIRRSDRTPCPLRARSMPFHRRPSRSPEPAARLRRPGVSIPAP